MMNENETMTEYVTRGEFREAMGRIDQRFEKIDQRFEKIDQRFEQIDQRFEKIDQRFEKIDQRFEQVDQRFVTLKDEIVGALLPEIARMLSAHTESLRAEFRVLDDKLSGVDRRVTSLESADLPVRVGRLGTEVFPPPARRTRRRRAS